ncbi:MAG: ABC transporter permease [Candidatus Bipolaricaulia bacterium]
MPTRMEGIKKGWYKFSRNPTSVAGLIIVLLVSVVAAFAPWIAPHPQHAGKFVDFMNASQPPSWQHPFGTDTVGRDILSRVFFGYRFSLLMGVIVLALVVPVGVTLGLIAGYFHHTWIDTVIMRVTDMFLAIPPLVLAMAITAILTPNLFNAMIAVSLMWWPWYTRLVYSIVSSLRHESFVSAAEVIGAGKLHIFFKELLPNSLSPIFTKMTLDMGFVILIGAMLSFVGLGVQPPRPGLGTMVADGAKNMPDQWWISILPSLAILVVVLGFNLVGDGLRDLFDVDV